MGVDASVRVEMASVSVTEQTRLQVERAQRAAQEARERCRVAKGGSLRLGPEGQACEPAGLDEDRAADYGAD